MTAPKSRLHTTVQAVAKTLVSLCQNESTIPGVYDCISGKSPQVQDAISKRGHKLEDVFRGKGRSRTYAHLLCIIFMTM